MSTRTRVFITSAYSDPEPISTFLASTKMDKFRKHEQTEVVEEADIILFVENSRYAYDYFFGRLRNHPLVKRYPDKVFMYNPHDSPWFILRGMYPCVPRQRFDDKLMAASPYVEVNNQHIVCDNSSIPKFLYSFYGGPTSATRKEIYKMKEHPRGKVIRSPAHIFYNAEKPLTPQLQYAALITDSKFVLCPKGGGPASIRLFEVMKAGRVPVIISDNFVFPVGPDWNKCSIYVSENQIHEIPRLLEKEEANWLEKSRLARKYWEDFFAPDSIFNYFIDTILELKKNDHKMSIRLRYLHFCSLIDYVVFKLARENLRWLHKRLKMGAGIKLK
ncbi:MAG TPA: exostosin family protein [Chryseolinea sp.]